MSEANIHAFDEFNATEAESFGFFNYIGVHLRFGVLYVQKEGSPEQPIASFDHFSNRWLLFRDEKYYTDLEVLVNA